METGMACQWFARIRVSRRDPVLLATPATRALFNQTAREEFHLKLTQGKWTEWRFRIRAYIIRSLGNLFQKSNAAAHE